MEPLRPKSCDLSDPKQSPPSRFEGSQPTSLGPHEAGRWLLTHSHYYDSPCAQSTCFCHLNLKQHLLLSATFSNKPVGSQGTPRMAGATQDALAPDHTWVCPPAHPATHHTPKRLCSERPRALPLEVLHLGSNPDSITLTSWVTLGKIFHHSGPPFPHLHNGENAISYLIK